MDPNTELRDTISVVSRSQYPFVQPDYVAHRRIRYRVSVSEDTCDQTLAPPRPGKWAIDVHAAIASGFRESAQVAHDRAHAVIDQLWIRLGENVVDPLCARGSALAATVSGEIAGFDPAVIDVA